MDAESIKEFFRPTKIKIRITLFLTILFLLEVISLLYFISPGRCNTYISTILYESIFYLIGLLLKIISLFFSLLYRGITILAIEMIFGFFLLLILLY